MSFHEDWLMSLKR